MNIKEWMPYLVGLLGAFTAIYTVVTGRAQRAATAKQMAATADKTKQDISDAIIDRLREEIKDIIHIQLRDNVKARVLDNSLANNYVPSAGKKKTRSQIETYNYLHRKIVKPVETRSN